MKVFINLAVADLDRSRRFFTGLGFGFDERFSDEKAIAMVISEAAVVMLLRRAFFQTFTPHPLTDGTSTEVLIAVQCENREAVDAMVARALATGGSAVRPPEDHGFMYGHAFADPDGHIWEPHWMDPAALEPKNA